MENLEVSWFRTLAGTILLKTDQPGVQSSTSFTNIAKALAGTGCWNKKGGDVRCDIP